MMNLAQRAAIETTEDREASEKPRRDKLLLLNPDPEDQPAMVEVYVQTYPYPGRPKAGFALKPDSTEFCTGGLEWKRPSDGEHALFVTFVFLPSTSPTIYATEIDCDLPYSAAYGEPEERKQSLCIPYGAYRAGYQFFVHFSNGERHDPEIVVTPL